MPPTPRTSDLFKPTGHVAVFCLFIGAASALAQEPSARAPAFAEASAGPRRSSESAGGQGEQSETRRERRGGGVPAATREEPILVPATPPRGFESFEQLWQNYRTAEQNGDSQAMERALARTQQIRVDRTVREVRDLALAFTYRARAHLDRGELLQGETWLTRARAMAPELALPRFGFAEAARLKGGTGLAWYVSESVAAYLASSRATFAGANLAFLSSMAVVVGVLVFSLLMVYRYGVLVSHDFSERVGERFGSFMVLALTVAALLLPLLLSLGPGWLPFYWLVVTFAYQSYQEKALSAIALAALFLAAPLVELNALWSRTWLNPVYRSAVSVVDGTTLPSDVRILEAAVASSPGDEDLEFMLASVMKRLGDYERAAILYRRILERNPNDVKARINLGSIYYAQHDYDGAKLEYRKATEIDPQSVLAFYDLSQVHAVNFEFKERDQARGRAESLDRDRVREWAALEYRGISGDGSSEAGAGVVDVMFDASEVRAKFLGLREGLHPARLETSLGALITGRGKRFWIGAVVLLVLLVLVESLLSFRRLTQRCWKCSSPFCGRCQIGTGRRGLCTQCHHLFVTKDGVSAAARNEKLARVQETARKRRWVFRALSIVAPGAGHIAEDRTALGVMLLGVWAFGWCFLLTPHVLFPRSDAIMALAETTVVTAFTGVLLAAAFVTANSAAPPPLRG